MSQIITATAAISVDEPCLGLVEMNLVRPDSKGIHRYMILTVMRNDKPAEFRVDLGPSGQFKVEEFRIPGGAKDEITGRYYIEHNVGELVEIANILREGPYEKPEPPPTTDLVTAFFDQPEIRRKNRKKTSSFGFGGTLQRS